MSRSINRRLNLGQRAWYPNAGDATHVCYYTIAHFGLTASLHGAASIPFFLTYKVIYYL